ncbi:hypothetical protein AQUCO_02600380v1 [Aquilegia coerulea]|uniref:Uncharacterized protein n=1 Tax=Aquilegia coerulea TaxID=218851 RepID=A0A2G5D9K9_AQUCA|nr:hypothetical protein AQUCO_02600380v1 [Aquilegia coerulea]
MFIATKISQNMGLEGWQADKDKEKEGKMQAVKDKLSDMATMRQVKADAKAEEKAEKEIAKTRIEVAKEVRKAKEAEAEMDLHVAKAGEKVQRQIEKHMTDLEHDPFVGIADDDNGHSSENIGHSNIARTTDHGTVPTSTTGMTDPRSSPTSNKHM